MRDEILTSAIQLCFHCFSLCALWAYLKPTEVKAKIQMAQNVSTGYYSTKIIYSSKHTGLNSDLIYTPDSHLDNSIHFCTNVICTNVNESKMSPIVQI